MNDYYRNEIGRQRMRALARELGQDRVTMETPHINKQHAGFSARQVRRYRAKLTRTGKKK